MDPQPKSMVLPIAITVLISALVFGIGGYYLASSPSGTDTSSGVLTTPTAKTSASPTATATASTDATSGWKTYAATTYGYTFKYDPAWDLRATRYPIEIELDLAHIATNHDSIYTESSSDATRIAAIEAGTAGASTTVGGLTWKSYTFADDNPGELADSRATLAAVTKKGTKSYIIRFADSAVKKITDADVQAFLSGFKITE